MNCTCIPRLSHLNSSACMNERDWTINRMHACDWTNERMNEFDWTNEWKRTTAPAGGGDPMRIAQQAEAASVIAVLKASGMRRAEEKTVDAVVVYSDVQPDVAGRYALRDGRKMSKHSPHHRSPALTRRTHLSNRQRLIERPRVKPRFFFFSPPKPRFFSLAA